MNIDWISVGAKYTDGRHVEFADYFKNANWMEIPVKLAMSPAIAIDETIKHFDIRKVSHVAIINDCAPFGLYGIKAEFKQGIVDIFVMDIGNTVVSIAAVKHF
jgi:hypothetical protein